MWSIWAEETSRCNKWGERGRNKREHKRRDGKEEEIECQAEGLPTRITHSEVSLCLLPQRRTPFPPFARMMYDIHASK